MKPIIDISFWQAPLAIDYDKLADQVDGVIIRAAYGTGEDTKFDQHYLELSARGIPVGAYHYLIGSQSMSKQASAFNEITAGKELKLGRWMDVEDTRSGTRLYLNQVLEYAALMPDMGIYTSRSKWHEIMGGMYLTDRKLWVAHYTTASAPLMPVGFSSYWLWQYSSTGKLDGYNGNLDMNRFGGSEQEWLAWIGEEEPDPEPDPEPEPQEPLFQARVYSWATPYVNVRNKPSTSGTVVGKNYPNDIVDVVRNDGEWLALLNGYSMSKYYERISEPVDPEPPVIPDPVEPEPEPTIPDGLLDVPHYSQTDPLWAQDIIGASNYNIGAKGCLLTITAAGLTFFGFQANPMAYNCLASSRGGYLITEENGKKYANMYWKFPDELTKGLIFRDEYQTFASGTGWESSANSILSKGKPVWCEVRLNNYQHWVLILGKVDGDYWILDPIDGAVKELDYPLVYRTVSYSKRGA